MKSRWWNLLGGGEVEIPDRQPVWRIWDRIKISRRYSIITNPAPILRIEDVAESGVVLNTQEMNLPALDEFIGELIHHRDILATVADSSDNHENV